MYDETVADTRDGFTGRAHQHAGAVNLHMPLRVAQHTEDGCSVGCDRAGHFDSLWHHDILPRMYCHDAE
jgi:hypothetical protein